MLHITKPSRTWNLKYLSTKIAYWALLIILYYPHYTIDNVLIHYITEEERQAFVSILVYLLYQTFWDAFRFGYIVIFTIWHPPETMKKRWIPFDNLFDITLATTLLCLSNIYNTLDNSYTPALVAIWIIKIFYKIHLIPYHHSAFLYMDIMVDFFACTALLFGGVLVAFDNNIHVLFMYILQVISVSLVLNKTFLRF